MLNFRADKTKGDAPPGFTLDKQEQRRQQYRLRRREWRAIITLPLALALVIGVMYAALGMMPQAHAQAQLLPDELALPPMARPDLAQALPMPAAEHIANQRDKAAADIDMLTRGQTQPPPLSLYPDYLAAWVTEQLARDTVAPPLPERPDLRSLMLDELPVNVPIATRARLVEETALPVAGGTPWQALLLGFPGEQYAVALLPTPAEGLTIDSDIALVGRYLGQRRSAGPESGGAGVPLIAARVVAPAQLATTDPRWQTEGGFRLPDDLYADVVDDRRVIETRAYYHLLGQAQRIDVQEERLADPAAWYNANLHADALFHAPGKHRGEMVHVSGYVHGYREDSEVAQDKPFGVARALRLVIWSRDLSELTVGYQPNEQKTPVKRLKNVLRLFEIAIAGDQPPPAIGSKISVTGRFLKKHSIPIQPMAEHVATELGVPIGTDLINTFFIVAPRYRVVPPPPPYEFHWLHAALLGGALTMIGLLWWMIRRDHRQQAQVGELVRKLRTTRHQLARNAKAVAAATADPQPAVPPPAGAPPR